uniref:WYL domain-containing protein n=1 Tax=Tenacibaculum halocynthiae TaxID=1254437 RepID=UPI003D64CC1B
IKHTEDGVTFNILVQPNFELQRLILGFGDAIKIQKPERLKKRIHQKLSKAIRRYPNSENKEND